jgi:hypothetical protein
MHTETGMPPTHEIVDDLIGDLVFLLEHPEHLRPEDFFKGLQVGPRHNIKSPGRRKEAVRDKRMEMGMKPVGMIAEGVEHLSGRQGQYCQP